MSHKRVLKLGRWVAGGKGPTDGFWGAADIPSLTSVHLIQFIKPHVYFYAFPYNVCAISQQKMFKEIGGFEKVLK